MVTTKTIGNRIADARKKITLSQAQLAQRLFISSQAVGKWERGESMPDIITLYRLAEIFGVDLNYFSESYSSAGTEMSAETLLAMQTEEIPSGKHKNRLSWDMSRGNWVGADFTGVVIKSGGFTGISVKSGDSGKNTIEKAVWNRTSFLDTQIADIVFTGTLEDCYFENCAFKRVTFQNATLANTFFKNNKNLKRISFIDCKADRMTYEFLKQGKAD
jgi:transcriptional regulator with XRE-family HTH domain